MVADYFEDHNPWVDPVRERKSKSKSKSKSKLNDKKWKIKTAKDK